MIGNEESQNLLIEEMEKLRQEILAVYKSSGKKVTGEFEQGLEIQYGTNQAILNGYEYLGGRRAGKQPPIQAIEKWLNDKGITPIESKMSVSSLAYLIARKIAKEGTKKENNLAIYSQVITPERIDHILQKINQLNANAFINEVVGVITKAFNDFQ